MIASLTDECLSKCRSSETRGQPLQLVQTRAVLKKREEKKSGILHVSSANHREHFVHASLPPDNVSFEFSQEVSTA